MEDCIEQFGIPGTHSEWPTSKWKLPGLYLNHPLENCKDTKAYFDKKNYWLKEKLELLNDRVGDYSQMSIKLETNNFFCIIAQMLSYSVINSFCCWFHSVTFVLITCIEVSNQFPGEFNKLIKQNKPETSYLSFAIRQT